MADCCDDFTRSHLLRGSVAKAGAGLPIIEPGMPVPAGTGLTRRSVLLRSAGLALAGYGAGKTLTTHALEAAGAEAAGGPAMGYDSPNQSHFTSRHFWEVGATDPNATTGWLGRYLDRVGSVNVPIQGLSLDGSLSPQLATQTVAVAATNNISDY